MLAKEKFSMIKLRVNLFKLIYVFIYIYSINAFSEENKLINIIEEDWNSSQTISGRFLKKLMMLFFQEIFIFRSHINLILHMIMD